MFCNLYNFQIFSRNEYYFKFSQDFVVFRIEENITENKGTDTFEEGIVDSEHVNDDDNPARQPDRRDQKGNGFDDNINEKTVGSESPDSQKINDMNRYANIDNAQTRVLNPDEKDSIR